MNRACRRAVEAYSTPLGNPRLPLLMATQLEARPKLSQVAQIGETIPRSVWTTLRGQPTSTVAMSKR